MFNIGNLEHKGFFYYIKNIKLNMSAKVYINTNKCLKDLG